jgi:hypothetical protein
VPDLLALREVGMQAVRVRVRHEGEGVERGGAFAGAAPHRREAGRRRGRLVGHDEDSRSARGFHSELPSGDEWQSQLEPPAVRLPHRHDVAAARARETAGERTAQPRAARGAAPGRRPGRRRPAGRCRGRAGRAARRRTRGPRRRRSPRRGPRSPRCATPARSRSAAPRCPRRSRRGSCRHDGRRRTDAGTALRSPSGPAAETSGRRSRTGSKPSVQARFRAVRDRTKG